MSFRATAILLTLLASIGTISCTLFLSAKEKIVMKRAPDDLQCESSLLTIRQTGEHSYRVLGCNRKANYALECLGDDTDNCRATLVSINN